MSQSKRRARYRLEYTLEAVSHALLAARGENTLNRGVSNLHACDILRFSIKYIVITLYLD